MPRKVLIEMSSAALSKALKTRENVRVCECKTFPQVNGSPDLNAVAGYIRGLYGDKVKIVFHGFDSVNLSAHIYTENESVTSRDEIAKDEGDY